MFSIIKPEDFGKTISKSEAGVWDVKFDTEQMYNSEQGLHLKNPVLKSVRAKEIVSGSLKGNVLEYTKMDSSKLTVDLTPIVPKNTNDKFLKTVTYDRDNTKLVFTVGSKTEDKMVYRTNVSDLLTVSTDGAIQGKGNSSQPLTVKVKPSSDIKVTDDGITFSGSLELEDSFGKSIGYLVSMPPASEGRDTQ